MPALLGAANLLGGIAALRVIALPAAVLVFAVPIPAPLLNQILWRLQIWTADFTGLLLRVIGMSRARLGRSHHPARGPVPDHRDVQRPAFDRDARACSRS